MWYRCIWPHFSECRLLCTLLQHLYEFVAVDFLLDSPFIPDRYWNANTTSRRRTLLSVLDDLVRLSYLSIFALTFLF